MVIDFQKKVKINLKETLEGSFERFLVFECHKCKESNKSFSKNKLCSYCFLKNLHSFKNSKFKNIYIEAQEILFTYEQLAPLFEYFEKINILQKHWTSFLKNIEKTIKSKLISPNKLKRIIELMEIEEFQLLNPIIMYKLINSIELVAKELIKNNSNKSVLDLILYNINNLINFFQELKIIQKFIEEKINFNFQDNELDILLSLLKSNLNSNHLSKNLIKEQVLNTIIKEQHVDEYSVGNNEIYHARIYEIRDEAEKYYEIYPFYYFIEEKSYFSKIIELITDETDSIEINEIISVENLINQYFHKFKDLLKTKYSFSKKNTERIAFLSAIKKIKFEKIFPLLLDDYIEEIFLDNPYDFIYINHLKYGRCRTRIRLNISEIDRFKTFVRLYSGKRLDYSHPSIKHVIKNQFFYCRFSIDIDPINLNGFAVDIRKLNKKIFTIQDLLKNETLSPLMAAFLFFLIINRINITVTGETDTGKTTLINALDLLTPKEFRKIYIENVIESLDQNLFEKHQLKYKVDSIEDYQEFKYTKSNQIKKLLHRTPDIIYLGEILTKEEAEAMFHCLSVGLRGFQTIHSNDINSLINRFLYHFNINLSCLKDLGIIILMKKLTNERKIISISELSLDLKEKDLSIINLFQYQPKLKNWNQNNSLFESNCVQNLLLFEDLTENKFYEILNLYNEIFKLLKDSKRLKNEDLIILFHSLSYYSRYKFENLKEFWKNFRLKYFRSV